MPLSSEELIAQLEAAGVTFKLHKHAAVATVEMQEAALVGCSGTVIKNLFIKDKKNRLYVVSAMPGTKVDLNVLSARLGTGKGGVRFAPEELLQEVLQVPAGSVTPLVVANPEAKDVVLFLDKGIQQAASIFVHPLVNTASLEMTPAALETALRACGRSPIFVDLEADPKIDRDNPPDLAQYTIAPPAKPDAAATPAPSTPSPATGDQTAAATTAPKAGGAGEAAGGGKKSSKAMVAKKASAPPALSLYEQHQALTSVHDVTQQLLARVSEALQSPEGSLTASLDPYTLKRLTADIESQLTTMKNAAYAMGYTAGKEEVIAFAQRRFA